MRLDIQICLLLAILLAGCVQTQIWEKEGGSQQAFNLDARECEFFAKKFSLQQSENGKIPDPDLFSKSYVGCLNAKGWQIKITAPNPEAENVPESKTTDLAQFLNANTVSGFGQTVTVPNTYTLISNKQFQIGTTLIHQFFWKGIDTSFINIFFQKSTAAPFKQIPYPVSEPYLLYTSGEGKMARERLQWATFFGIIDSNWIMGTGAYYYVDKKERIVIAITKPLDKPQGETTGNVILTRNQYLQIEQFSKQWRNWLNMEFTKGSGISKKLIKILRWGI
jgi:hypothetical protein